MLSMKFPHLLLRPEIIITFLWGWEWSGGGGGGGQVRHRSPRNSVLHYDVYTVCLWIKISLCYIRIRVCWLLLVFYYIV